MKKKPNPNTRSKLVLRGLNLWLTDALKANITKKAERLFRHEPRIIRIRIGLDCEHLRTGRRFCALGQIEVLGPDLLASVTSQNAYKAIDLLIKKLDRMLRRRVTALRSGRTAGDIRAHKVES